MQSLKVSPRIFTNWEKEVFFPGEVYYFEQISQQQNRLIAISVCRLSIHAKVSVLCSSYVFSRWKYLIKSICSNICKVFLGVFSSTWVYFWSTWIFSDVLGFYFGPVGMTEVFFVKFLFGFWLGGFPCRDRRSLVQFVQRTWDQCGLSVQLPIWFCLSASSKMGTKIVVRRKCVVFARKLNSV